MIFVGAAHMRLRNWFRSEEQSLRRTDMHLVLELLITSTKALQAVIDRRFAIGACCRAGPGCFGRALEPAARHPVFLPLRPNLWRSIGISIPFCSWRATGAMRRPQSDVHPATYDPDMGQQGCKQKKSLCHVCKSSPAACKPHRKIFS